MDILLLVTLAILAAVFVGFAVPVLLQLRATLRSAQSFLDTTGPRLDRTLDEITAAAERINRVAGEVESRIGKLSELAQEAVELGRQVRNVRSSLRRAVDVGVAFGPALIAALRAFFGKSNSRPEADDEPAPEREGGKRVSEEARS